MPTEPNISLGVVGGGSGPMQAGYQGTNPLSLIGNVVDLQSKQLALQQARATFAAKQKFGKIMAGADSVEAGLASASQDPEVQAFVPEVAQTVQQTQKIAQEYKGQLQGQTADAFQHVAPLLISGFVDPGAMRRNLPSILNNIPDKGVRETVRQSSENLIDGLSVGLKDNPDNDPKIAAANRDVYVKNLTAASLATGSMDALLKIGGTAGQMTGVGGTVQPTLTAPTLPAPTVSGSAPGSLSLAGPGQRQGITPQLAPDKSVPFTGGGGGGSSPNPLAIPTPKSAPGPAASQAPVTMSSLGFQLFDPKTDLANAPASAVRDISGNPAGLEGQRAETLMKEFTEKGKDRYEGAVNLKGQLAQIDHDLTGMAKGGGYLVPGSGADLRLALGKLKSTVQTMTGEKPDVDTQKVALGENFNKVVQQMAGSLLNNMYGQQREAAETIKNITDKGVPGISNSLMGGKMITAMFGAVADRSMEKYQFDNEWANARNGDLRGADVAFNKKFPAKMYIDKALADIGMTETGFSDDKSGLESLKRARDAGLFTDQQYKAILSHGGKIPDDLPKTPTAKAK